MTDRDSDADAGSGGGGSDADSNGDGDPRFYHVNGEVVPASEATVSVRDRGFLYGDAAFETLRAYGGTVFECDTHIGRLRNTCETLGMGDAVPEDLTERVDATLAANDLTNVYVRVSVTRGSQPGKLTLRPEVFPLDRRHRRPARARGPRRGRRRRTAPRPSRRSERGPSPTARFPPARRPTTT
jgi:branched-subunit amino acid aminotransferase/4-amino-4-deoxychorismate lyase